MVELMITIAIVAILLAVAFPSFQGSLRSNRLATASNELMASLSLARSEAIRNPAGAAICTSLDGAICGGDWNDGWIVWIDEDDDGVPGGVNDRVVRYVQGRDTLAFTATSTPAGEENNIFFDNRGRVVPQATRMITLQPSDCPTGQELVRALNINLTGQMTIDRGPCT